VDRRRARRAFLIAAAAALAAAAAAPALPLKAARWLAAGSDPVDTLGREPAECLTRADDPSVTIGRAAFRAPLLLGGQAARAGLSCNSCHVNGHDNAAFVFPGLSGAPGTADVTHSLMSKTRGDGVFNPKPIPSLYAPARLAERAPQSRALEAFIRGLVVDEFDGAEPPPAVLAGLADYVRALSPASAPDRVAVTLARHIGDVDAAAAAATIMLANGDGDGFRLMLGAARSALGLIAERYPVAEFAREQAILRALDRELAAVGVAGSAERLTVWRGGLAERLAPLAASEARSLFAHDRLAARGDRR
jgi:hypothetical protein